jgi:predicted membrane protein
MVMQRTSISAHDEATPGLPTQASIHLPSLFVALTLMLGGTMYPLVFAHADGTADHGLAVALFWAMSAGFVRGVGFVPRHWVWRLLFSGWSCVAGLVLASWLRWGF